MPIMDNFKYQYISNASEYEHGLMSANDKLKLDNIQLSDLEYIQEGLDEINEYMVPQFIYGIKIDTTNSDPDTAVTYTDDASGFIPLKVDQSTGVCNYGSWKDIIDNVLGVKPCLMKKDGTLITYLDPDNYNKTVNGNTIDIESGDLGQVMIRFKHIYYKFSMDGDKLWFQISNKQNDSTWVDTAFAAEDGIGSVKSEMYVSAYETVLKNNMLQSISNNKPSTGLNFTSVDKSSSFGVFHMMNVARKEFIILLGYLVTKSINLMSNIGKGNHYTPGSGTLLNTGTMNDKGLFYGKQTNEGVKLFGIENLWGNSLKYMNGMIQKLIYVIDKETGYTVPEQHIFIKESYPYDNIEDFDDGGIIGINKVYIKELKFLSDSIYIPDPTKSASSSTYYKSLFYNTESTSTSNILNALYGNYSAMTGSDFLMLADTEIFEDTNIPITTHIIY